MVKRQTVWLSTMMVLSLMLIGYYTMNGGDGTGLGSNDNGTSVTTGVEQQPTDGGSTPAGNSNDNSKKTQGNSDASKTQGASGSTTPSSGTDTNKGATTGSTSATPTGGNDWFANYQTQIDQTLAQKEDAFLQVINSNSASSDQVAQAQQKLTNLENIVGGLKSAEDQIIGEGYTNCVIVPVASGQSALDKAQVYVKTKTLSATDAVQVMNIVSQQLGLPITSVQVIAHQ